ncbi:hypothetical protein AAKU55_005399 [Oxalobacteraceae bacterium GrIS 1.11]
MSLATHLTVAGQPRLLLTRADSIDFRDRLYVATLVEVPPRRELSLYLQAQVPVLDQGLDGACTGFALATVAHYLLRTRRVGPDDAAVSATMLYDMARRYDEWAGIDYQGSSCRGAIKGWYKHGVCGAALWGAGQAGVLSAEVASDAALRPLGAYLRVNHKSLVDMHAAISEAGVLYASASVHQGWQQAQADGIIEFDPTAIGGHAFAIVGYDEHGFWLQNSWGAAWGLAGCGHISYRDWLRHGSDVWVARLGAPVLLAAGPRAEHAARAGGVGAVRAKSYLYNEIRPHVVSIKQDGQLNEHGDIATSADMVRHILREDFPRITANWKKKRLVLYAHGGLTEQDAALQRVAECRLAMLDAECYPLAFVWHSDYWSTLGDMLADAVRRRRPEGALDSASDFMLDRLDDLLEPISRIFTGKAEWTEMKRNALQASTSETGGARLVADEIAALIAAGHEVELHLVAHSAGAVFHAPLVQYLCGKGAPGAGPMAGSAGLGLSVATCTLWAPACTTELFKQSYLPAMRAGAVARLRLFTLTERAEQDDNCAHIYNKSLLYLVSNAFEAAFRVPLLHPDGEAILGMEKFIGKDEELQALFDGAGADWIRSPNTEAPGTPGAAQAVHHGDFDDDDATLQATIAGITGQPLASLPASLIKPTAGARERLRYRLDRVNIAARK